LDSKAGIVLGFAGAVIALSSDVSRWYRTVGIVSLALAAALAAAGFFPRRLPALDVAHLRTYVRADEQFTKLTLHDTEIEMIQQGADLLHRKSLLVKWSVVLLGVGAVTLATGIIVGGHYG
jgi:hypothetical protein